MAYRISLHLLATLWHMFMLAWAISLKKNHRFYFYLIPVCFFSGSFTAAWTIGLLFKSDMAMRLTWFGAMWPAALIFFLREMFDLPSNKPLIYWVWGMAGLTTLGGMSPVGLIKISEFDPNVMAIYGPLEPYLRILLLINISLILWTAIKLLFNPIKQRTWVDVTALIGFTIYGIGALLTSALLPIFGEYRLLESTSYGSVIWSTFAVWFVFKDLQDRNKSLAELNDLKKIFINHITHEFRTPLHTISSAMDVISGIYTPDQKLLQDYYQMVMGNVNRLSEFVDELLDLAAIQTAKITLNKDNVDLYSLVKTVVKRIKPMIDKKNIHLNVVGESTLCLCDPRKIEQVISNLISNAIKASENGQVDVKIITEPHQVGIYICDNGHGIAVDHLPHIFSSFYTVSIKNSPIKGSGLGLAISKGWIEAHGGHIHAESDGIGKGSRFWFTLPKEN